MSYLYTERGDHGRGQQLQTLSVLHNKNIFMAAAKKKAVKKVAKKAVKKAVKKVAKKAVKKTAKRA
jgi:hypothetical protein